MLRLFLSLYAYLLITFFAFSATYIFIDVEFNGDIDSVIATKNLTPELTFLDKLAPSMSADEYQEALHFIGQNNQITIKPIAYAALPDWAKEKLQTQPVWIHELKTGYFRIGQPAQFYIAQEDVKNPDFIHRESMALIGIVLLCVFFGVGISFWLTSLQGKLRKIEHTLIAISEGDLSARTSTKSLHRVGQINERTNQMATQLQNLMLEHKKLTHMVAHDVRLPVFRAQLQLETLLDSEIPDKTQIVNDIEDDLLEIELLINEFLNHTKEQSQTLALKPTPCSISDLEEIINKAFNLGTSKTLLINELTQQVQFSLDLIHINRALSNLIYNACRHAHLHLHVCLKQLDTKHITIDIDDDGPGIPEPIKNELFKPYVKSGMVEYDAGYGLGLAIAKLIIHSHQGNIQILDSHLGGAKFRITLPCAYTD